MLVVDYLIQDGSSNYLNGVMLLEREFFPRRCMTIPARALLTVTIALAFYVYPNEAASIKYPS